MDDTEASSTNVSKVHRRPHDTNSEELFPGTSGTTLAPTPNFHPTDEDDDRGATPRCTRRGRVSNHFKGSDYPHTKTLIGDSDRKNGSPSDPASYLNSVRSNLNFDLSSSPMIERSAGGTPSHGSNGNHVGYKSSHKKKNRLNESGGHNKPAEIFRKDLISAMKIPDTSHLSPDEYWVMRDHWRIEWEKGVQVPVNADALPAVQIDVVPKDAKRDFRMPKKLIKTMPDIGDRDTVNLNVLADGTCRYDLDEVDVSWLKVINEERYWQGYEPLDEFTMEIIMEELETQCHENMQLAIKTKKGLGIEYDENIVCDVCRSPDCEEGNEMVFCDGCNLCVHQACYGILKVPDGSWLCKPCALGIRGSAVCVLCGQQGGAMKSTKSGRKWAHMSCALWIPEINIADPERMEPITKISHIPTSRWSLLCVVCKEKSVGACIQCCVKQCVTAYHVTCAMKAGFDMVTDCCSPNSASVAGESAIAFRSFCKKHSKNLKKKPEQPSPGKRTEEERRSDRQRLIAELEGDFHALVRNEGVANSLNIPADTIGQVMAYWRLKRRANFNRPLVTPKQEEGKELAEAAETGLQRRLRMFTHLRQDLERVRNLCYMIGKREKIKRSAVTAMKNVFLEQSHYMEKLMLQSKDFNPKTLLPSLTKCGSARLVELAKAESRELAKTKEWCPENSGNDSLEPQLPDDVEDAGETIRLSQARVAVAAIEKEPDTKPRNGLLKSRRGKHPKSRPKAGKARQSDLKKRGEGSSASTDSETDAVGRRKTTFAPSSDKVRGPGQRSKHDDVPACDTVKERGLKRKSPPGGGDSKKEDEDRRVCGKDESARKKMRVKNDVLSSKARKEQSEKPRRSPRHNDSSDTEDFDMPESAAKPKMTVRTETISETERVDDKRQRVAREGRKRALPKSLEKQPSRDIKKGKSETEQSKGEKSSDKKENSSERTKARDPQSESSSDEFSCPGATAKTKAHSKNEKRALAPKNVADKGGVNDGAPNRDPAQSPIVQELEQKHSPPYDSPGHGTKCAPPRRSERKSPIIPLETPNPAFIAAGLNISYGSNAPLPLRQKSACKSPPGPSRAGGLKWVSLCEDGGASKSDSPGTVPLLAKDAVKECDKKRAPTRERHALSRRQSAVNPGKYRTGIGVYSPKSSDSSDDDFDIPVPSPSENMQRQKPRSPSNGGPKNARAAGGIPDAPKSGRDLGTAGGRDTQDSFFDGTSGTPSPGTARRDSRDGFADEISGVAGRPGPTAFDPGRYVPARLLDFQQGAFFRSHSLFPFGTAINPWQAPGQAPSILPGQSRFYGYPARDTSLEARPSPPPLPDSTLSPESCVANSVAVQASPGHSGVSQNSDCKRAVNVQRDSKHVVKTNVSPVNFFDDNEWEVVHDDDATQNVTQNADQHRRKHKKRKKKKKKRKRMLFPDGYETERREMSSPLSGLPDPIHGAIVPRGYSTQFGRTEISSVDSENTESEKAQKLVLKINKKDLASGDDRGRADCSAGLKLTIKKSDYERSEKRRKRDKRERRLKSEVCDSDAGPGQDRKSVYLKRLGVAVDDAGDHGGIGRRALRERKPSRPAEPDADTVDKVANSKPRRSAKKSVHENRSKISLGSSRKNDSRTDRNNNSTVAAGKIPKRSKMKRKSPKRDKTEERKDLAKFAGWTTKSSDNSKTAPSIRSVTSQFTPSAGLSGRGAAAPPVRSFSTDSDHAHPGANSQDSQPARHWKKRKVHEHETQASERHDFGGSDGAPPPAGPGDVGKTWKTRPGDFSGKGERAASGQAKGQKLDMIISSLGAKASVRAGGRVSPKPTVKKAGPDRVSPKEKSFPGKFTTANFVAVADPGHDPGTHPSPAKRTKSVGSNPTPTKLNRPAYNMDFALQTGPLNFKIPKKLHHTVNEAKFADS